MKCPAGHRFLLFLAMVGIFIGAAGFQFSLRRWREPACHDQLHFQALSSELMQQTLPIDDLRERPIESLYCPGGPGSISSSRKAESSCSCCFRASSGSPSREHKIAERA